MALHRLLGTALTVAALVGAALPAQAQEPSRVKQTFTFAGKRQQFKGDKWTSSVVASTYNTEGWISVLEEIWNPGYKTQPKYHKIHRESFFMVSGKAEWTVGGETKVVGPLDCVHIPPFTPFSMKVVGNEDVKVVRMYQPGGYEVTQEYIDTLTPAQLKEAQVAKLLAKASDVYDAPAAMVKEKVKHHAPYFDLRSTRKAYDDDGASDVAVSSIQGAGAFNLQEEDWKVEFYVGPHYHNTKTETFYVLGGRVEWTVGGETHILSAGDAVHIPCNTWHSAKGLDGKKLHTLLMYQPFGYDTRLEVQNEMTPEQMKDPVFQKMLKTINDFNPIRLKK